jgi:hypothetical protein
MQKIRSKTSKAVALVAVFAAISVITDSFGGLPSSGVWYSWNFLIEPLTGILLGPLLGFTSTLIGVIIGHQIFFRGAFEIIFMLGAPIGTAISALLFKGQWKPVLIFYTALFAAYFLTPVAWQLPLWGMWETYIAFAILVAAIPFMKKEIWEHEASVNVSFSKKWMVGLSGGISLALTSLAICSAFQTNPLSITIALIIAEVVSWGFFMLALFAYYGALPKSVRIPIVFAISAFVGLEADVLFRIFLLIPGQMYRLFFDVGALQVIWGEGAIIAPVKVALSTAITIAIGYPLVKALKRAGYQTHH